MKDERHFWNGKKERKKKSLNMKTERETGFVQGTWDSAYYIILKSNNWLLYV